MVTNLNPITRFSKRTVNSPVHNKSFINSLYDIKWSPLCFLIVIKYGTCFKRYVQVVATNISTSHAELLAFASKEVKFEKEPNVAPAAEPDIAAFVNIIVRLASSLTSYAFVVDVPMLPDRNVKRT